MALGSHLLRGSRLNALTATVKMRSYPNMGIQLERDGPVGAGALPGWPGLDLGV